MTISHNFFTRVSGSLIASFFCASALFADLDERCFETYREGDLNGQKGWAVQSFSDGAWQNTSERVFVASNEKTGQPIIKWTAGYGGKDQTRITKSFPETTATKAVVTFEFLPGAQDLGGRLYLNQSEIGPVIAFQFKNGRLWILENGQKDATDTGVEFAAEDKNRIEVWLDFSTHKAKVFLDENPVGSYEIAPDYSRLNQLNLFAGGSDHSSELQDVRVLSVGAFPRKAGIE